MPLSSPPLSCWSSHHSIPSCFSERYLPVITSGPQGIPLRNVSTCRLLLVNQKSSLYFSVTHRTLVKVSIGYPECLQWAQLEIKAIKSQETLTDTPNQPSLFLSPSQGLGHSILISTSKKSLPLSFIAMMLDFGMTRDWKIGSVLFIIVVTNFLANIYFSTSEM